MQKLFIFIKKFKIVDNILYCIRLLICVKSVVLMFEYNFFFLPQRFTQFLTFEHFNFFMPLNILQIKFFYVAKNKKKR